MCAAAWASGGPRVDDHRAAGERRLELAAGSSGRDRRHDPAEQPRPGLVHRSHPREVAREASAGRRAAPARRRRSPSAPGAGRGAARSRSSTTTSRRSRSSTATRRRGSGRPCTESSCGSSDVVERAVHRRARTAARCPRRAGRSARPHRPAATRRSAAGTARPARAVSATRVADVLRRVAGRVERLGTGCDPTSNAVAVRSPAVLVARAAAPAPMTCVAPVSAARSRPPET